MTQSPPRVRFVLGVVAAVLTFVVPEVDLPTTAEHLIQGTLTLLAAYGIVPPQVHDHTD